MKTNIEAPWYEFRKKLYALFERDPEIIVSEVYETEDEEMPYGIDIEVLDHDKFVALDRVMPRTKTFGNVTLGIALFDEENTCDADIGIELFETIFKDNPIVKDIKDVEDFTGTRHGFVRFRPEVIQFFHDSLADYNGNWSGLAQDIAREVFEDARGIHFCTAPIGEADDEVAEPLGEWP